MTEPIPVRSTVNMQGFHVGQRKLLDPQDLQDPFIAMCLRERYLVPEDAGAAPLGQVPATAPTDATDTLPVTSSGPEER